MVAKDQEMKRKMNKVRKVREFYFKSGKVDILIKKKIKEKLKNESGRNVWGDCDINDFFPSLTKKDTFEENVSIQA